MKQGIQVILLLFCISFYGQNDTISVVRHSETDLIIPKDAKLVFRGITNELIIDVKKQQENYREA